MKPKETIKLVWSDFQTNVVDSFKMSRLTQEFSDVTLACDGTNNTIEAHRIILSSGSSFFQNILSTQTGQHPHPLLYLGGVRKTDLEAILDFIYHGQTKVPQMELLTFLQTAKKLGVTGLESDKEFISDKEKNIVAENLGDKEPMKTVKRYDDSLINDSVDNDKETLIQQLPESEEFELDMEDSINSAPNGLENMDL